MKVVAIGSEAGAIGSEAGTIGSEAGAIGSKPIANVYESGKNVFLHCFDFNQNIYKIFKETTLFCFL